MEEGDSDSDSDSDSFTRQLGNMKIGSDDSDSDSYSQQPKKLPRFRPARTKKERLELHKKYEEQQKDPIHQITRKVGDLGIKKKIIKKSKNHFNIDQVLKSIKDTNEKYKLNKPKKNSL